MTSKVDELQVSGWCLLEDVIPEDEAHSLYHRIENAPTPLDSFGTDESRPGKKTRAILNFDQTFAPYLADPRVMEVCEAFLGADLRIMETLYNSDIFADRGRWHADWPFSQDESIPGRFLAPYPDICAMITTIWMLTPFTPETGGTLVLPGTHKQPRNPTGEIGIDCWQPFPGEVQVTGRPGSVLMLDSRVWHARPVNHSKALRSMIRVMYVPWWLNLELWREGSDERSRMVEERGLDWPAIGLLPRSVFDQLPEKVKPLLRHWVAA